MDYSALINEWQSTTGAMFRFGGMKHMSSFAHGEMFILKYLSEQKNTVQPSELSNALNASSARIAMALRNLEHKGLIERVMNTTDRRRVIVSLTEEGKQFTAKHQAEMRERIEYLLRALGEEDTKEFIRIVGRIVDIFTLFEKETQQDKADDTDVFNCPHCKG